MDNINIDKIIDEVFYEMQYGKVDADIILFMKMHTTNSSHFEITPVLNLKNKKLLYRKIKEYVKSFEKVSLLVSALEKEGYVKRVITLMLSDMSVKDFNDPCLFVQKKIDFMNNQLLEDKIIDAPFFESKIFLSTEPYSKETPFCFVPRLMNGFDIYEFPTISYGISEETCYIYAIQDYNKYHDTNYSKKINRKLYKLNKDVLESETVEYKDYKEGKSDYYPENISDVSPGFIFALTLFLNEIYKKGITKVEVIPYLPIRYENKIKSFAKYTLKEAKKNDLSKEEKINLFKDLVNKQKDIQRNITEKFIRCFYRVAHHFDNVEITSIPFELDDRLHIKLSEFKYSDNEILNEIVNSDSKTI